MSTAFKHASALYQYYNHRAIFDMCEHTEAAAHATAAVEARSPAINALRRALRLLGQTLDRNNASRRSPFRQYVQLAEVHGLRANILESLHTASGNLAAPYQLSADVSKAYQVRDDVWV